MTFEVPPRMRVSRRGFGRMIVGTLAIASAARAHASTIPRVGFLRSTPAAPFAHIVDAFRAGLRDTGFIENESVAVEYRWADNRLDRLPALAGELVRGSVSVIVGNGVAAEAAKRATSTIPIVFVTSDDPVARGLVDNLRRPSGNATGITFFGGGSLGAKRLELLQELVPTAKVIAFLIDPKSPGSAVELAEVQALAAKQGRTVVVVRAASEREIEPAFAETRKANAAALVVGGSPLYTSQRRQVVGLAARHALPAIYDVREHVADGGLMSYAASFAGAYREAGSYVGRILKGAKPSDLPVMQPTKFELAINVRTATALGIAVPPSLLLRADEVIR